MITFATDDINYERARRAYYNISFEPEQRARSTQEEYVNELTALYEQYAPLATTDELRAELDAQMTRYKERYIKMMYAVLDAKARTASPMITGPARFPVDRNRKRIETEMKRTEEFLAWRDKAQAAIRRIFIPEEEYFISSDDPDALPKLQAKLETQKAKHAEMVEANKAARKDKQPNPYAPFELQNSNARIKATEQRIATFQLRAKREEAFQEQSGDGWRLYADDNRVCIAFDGKPERAMIDRLKSRAFKWSPTRTAWVRQFTSNAVYAAKEVLSIR